MDRFISEQAVLDVLNHAILLGRFYCGKERTIDEIKAIPSAEPKTGHWIYTPKRRLVDENDEGGVYITDYKCTCSECGGDFGFQKMSDAYCKYCGAKMFKP